MPCRRRTTIHSLGDDLLREIFLRLPSLPSLVRAALTCRGFLAAVRSSPAFRRRFRALHQPPLLGFFFEHNDKEGPTFLPIRRRSDPDIAAAVRGADFFLTRLPYHEDDCRGWMIQGCRGGRILVHYWRTEQIAVYNPVTRALDLFPMPPDEIFSAHQASFFFLYSDQSPDSFRVVASCYDKSRVRAAVFSSDTREWQILPCSRTYPQLSGNTCWLKGGWLVNGKLYSAHAVHAYMVVFDTATLQFSCMNLLQHLKGQGNHYGLGVTKDGKLCIVSVDGFTLTILFQRADDSSAEWMLHNVIPLEREILQATEMTEDELYEHMLEVQAVVDGTVYMSMDEQPILFLSFCLETRKLEKLFHRTTHDNCVSVYPYIMGGGLPS